MNCPYCGRDLISDQYHAGGRGYLAYLVCRFCGVLWEDTAYGRELIAQSKGKTA